MVTKYRLCYHFFNDENQESLTMLNEIVGCNLSKIPLKKRLRLRSARHKYLQLFTLQGFYTKHKYKIVQLE